MPMISTTVRNNAIGHKSGKVSANPFAWDDGYEFTTYIRKERKWMGDLIDIMTNPVFSKTGMKAVGWFDASGVKKVAGGGDHFAGNINTGSWVSYRFDVPKTS